MVGLFAGTQTPCWTSADLPLVGFGHPCMGLSLPLSSLDLLFECDTRFGPYWFFQIPGVIITLSLFWHLMIKRMYCIYLVSLSAFFSYE